MAANRIGTDGDLIHRCAGGILLTDEAHEGCVEITHQFGPNWLMSLTESVTRMFMMAWKLTGTPSAVIVSGKSC